MVRRGEPSSSTSKTGEKADVLSEMGKVTASMVPSRISRMRVGDTALSTTQMAPVGGWGHGEGAHRGQEGVAAVAIAHAVLDVASPSDGADDAEGIDQADAAVAAVGDDDAAIWEHPEPGGLVEQSLGGRPAVASEASVCPQDLCVELEPGEDRHVAIGGDAHDGVANAERDQDITVVEGDEAIAVDKVRKAQEELGVGVDDRQLAVGLKAADAIKAHHPQPPKGVEAEGRDLTKGALDAQEARAGGE